MDKVVIAMLGMNFEKNFFTKYLDENRRLTAEGKMIRNALEEKIFICPDCGRKVSFCELETWLADNIQDFVDNKVSCSECFEDAMGEDL